MAEHHRAFRSGTAVVVGALLTHGTYASPQIQRTSHPHDRFDVTVGSLPATELRENSEATNPTLQPLFSVPIAAEGLPSLDSTLSLSSSVSLAPTNEPAPTATQWTMPIPPGPTFVPTASGIAPILTPPEAVPEPTPVDPAKPTPVPSKDDPANATTPASPIPSSAEPLNPLDPTNPGEPAVPTIPAPPSAEPTKPTDPTLGPPLGPPPMNISPAPTALAQTPTELPTRAPTTVPSPSNATEPTAAPPSVDPTLPAGDPVDPIDPDGPTLEPLPENPPLPQPFDPAGPSPVPPPSDSTTLMPTFEPMPSTDAPSPPLVSFLPQPVLTDLTPVPPSTLIESVRAASSQSSESPMASASPSREARASGDEFGLMDEREPAVMQSGSTLESDSSLTGSTRGDSEDSVEVIDPDTARAEVELSGNLSDSFHDIARYNGVTFAGVSLVLLFSFQSVPFDSPLPWASTSWELLSYVTYLQQLFSISQLHLVDVPSPLWTFSDIFSWSNFVIQRSQITSEDLKDGERLRRLTEATFRRGFTGMDAYSLRVGIEPANLLVHVVVGACVVLCVCVLLFLLAMACGTPEACDKFEVTPSCIPSRKLLGIRRATLRSLGLGVLVWFMALYPLSAVASHELARQAHDIESSAIRMAIAIVVLVLWCGAGVVVAAIIVYTARDAQRRQVSTQSIWGALYTANRPTCRCFFVLPALVQVALGCSIGSIETTDNATELIVVIAIWVGYLAVTLYVRPFATRTPLVITVLVAALAILNYSISSVFIASGFNASRVTEQRVADALIGLNLAVLVLWVLRHLVLLVKLIWLSLHRSEYTYAEELGTPQDFDIQYLKDQAPTPRCNEYMAMTMTMAMSPSPSLSAVYSDYGGSVCNSSPRHGDQPHVGN